MSLTLRDFHSIGREYHYSIEQNILTRLFAWLFGPIGLHSRIRAGHIIRIIQQTGLPQDANVLDAGCGRGLVLFWLALRYPRYRLHGIEIDSAMVNQNRIVAQKMGLTSLTFKHGDLSSIDIPQATYDLIFSIDVLEHIVDDIQVLRKLRSALKPSGTLILHLPLRHQKQARIFPAFEHHIVDEHVRDEYVLDEIQTKLEKAGLEMSFWCYGFGWRGELAFELNNLFWDVPLARVGCALLTFPLAFFLAYQDVNATITQGNSFIVQAKIE
jgi:SAM-dependent methyltransferase